MASRAAAARFPDWFSISDGRLETYPLRFPTLTKFDDFKLTASRRRSDVPFSQYQRVGVDILDAPSFSNPSFFDPEANPKQYYTIPNGGPWHAYLNSVGVTEAQMSADVLTTQAQTAINYIADNLVEIKNDLLIDQLSESGVADTTVSYKRIFQRVAGRITAQIQAGQRTYRPLSVGGYIFYSNSDRGFWQYDLSGSGDKNRPLRFVQDYTGDWKQYNTSFAQERYKFMDGNFGTYWQGGNYTQGVYSFLNGVVFRMFADTKMTQAEAAANRNVIFTWDKMDNQGGSQTRNYEHVTTDPPGRLKLFQHTHPPIEWLRLAGFFGGAIENGFICWNEPERTVEDPNWLGSNGLAENNLAGNIWYPAGSTVGQPWPKAPVGQNGQASTMRAEGLIDYAMLGFRQGYEVRRALNGPPVSFRFLSFSLDAGPLISAQTTSADVLFAANESRGFILELTGSNGVKTDVYWNGYGDFNLHTVNIQRGGGVTDTMTGVLGTGLSYCTPYGGGNQ